MLWLWCDTDAVIDYCTWKWVPENLVRSIHSLLIQFKLEGKCDVPADVQLGVRYPKREMKIRSSTKMFILTVHFWISGNVSALAPLSLQYR